MTDRDPIEELLDRYRAAVDAKDVDEFLALYDDRVCVFDTWSQWTYEGSDRWREAVAAWFDSVGTERSVVDFDDVRTTVGSDMALAHALVTYRGMSAEGQHLRAMTNRLTWGLRKAGDGRWKVVHEHTSAPADPETLRITLQR